VITANGNRSDRYNQAVGYKHTKAEILEGAVAAAFDDGLSQLTFGRLARRLGISDRIVVYYFPTKSDLVSEVILEVGARLQGTLAPVLPDRPKTHRELVRAIWPAVSTTEADAVFGLFFEANGLATSGQEPYRTLVPMLVELWIDWAAGFFEGSAAQRRREAEAAIAVIDGLVLLRLLAGPRAASRAARTLGVA
jgi:AcrR family transcriptional regulator